MLRHPLSVSESVALREFLTAVRKLPGVEVKDARLFGSRARGEGHARSDLDVALIVADGGREHRHAIYDLAFDVGLVHGVELAPLVLDDAQWRHLQARERRIAAVIEAEGIPLP